MLSLVKFFSCFHQRSAPFFLSEHLFFNAFHYRLFRLSSQERWSVSSLRLLSPFLSCAASASPASVATTSTNTISTSGITRVTSHPRSVLRSVQSSGVGPISTAVQMLLVTRNSLFTPRPSLPRRPIVLFSAWFLPSAAPVSAASCFVYVRLFIKPSLSSFSVSGLGRTDSRAIAKKKTALAIRTRTPKDGKMGTGSEIKNDHFI